MNFVDRYSLSIHRAVAEKMITDESAVISIARANLDRWLNSESFDPNERHALLEWKEILDDSEPAVIRRIITADTDEGQRLRSSSPFVGILTPDELKKFWSECAEIGLA